MLFYDVAFCDIIHPAHAIIGPIVDGGIGSANDLIAKGSAVLTFGINVHFKGNILIGKPFCENERMFDRNAFIGACMPDKCGNGLFGNLIIGGNGAFGFGIAVVAENFLKRALVSVNVNGSNRIGQNHARRAVVALFHAEKRFDFIVVPHRTERSGKMSSRRKSDDKNIFGINVKLFRMVADVLHSGRGIDKRCRPKGATRCQRGIFQNESIEAGSQKMVRDRFGFDARASSITTAG